MKFSATVDKLKGQQADTILAHGLYASADLKRLMPLRVRYQWSMPNLTTTGKIIKFISLQQQRERT